MIFTAHKKSLILVLAACFFASAYCAATQTLYIEPQDGRTPIINFIDHAKTSLDVEMYEISDPPCIRALINDVKRGVKVEVILTPRVVGNYYYTQRTINTLKQGGVAVKKGYKIYRYTHEKMLLSDNKIAMIGTGNLDFTRYPDTRNFFLTITNPKEIKQIKYVFQKDWQRQSVWSLKSSSLVWSPNNSQTKLVNFIDSAKHTLDIYMLSISDRHVMDALRKAEYRGITVTIVMSKATQSWSWRELKILKEAGIHIIAITKPFIHAKVIIRDGKIAFLGSQNLTYGSLIKNRELGIITKQKGIVLQLLACFYRDKSKF